MAAKTSWHGHGTKLRHCHPVCRRTVIGFFRWWWWWWWWWWRWWTLYSTMVITVRKCNRVNAKTGKNNLESLHSRSHWPKIATNGQKCVTSWRRSIAEKVTFFILWPIINFDLDLTHERDIDRAKKNQNTNYLPVVSIPMFIALYPRPNLHTLWYSCSVSYGLRIVQLCN